MELRLKPGVKNIYPKKGILIQGSNIEIWIYEIQQMKMNLDSCSIYPLPGLYANTVWGCLVIPDNNRDIENTGRNSYCQSVNEILYIPEYTSIFPDVSATELRSLLNSVPHILHPTFGLFKLEETLCLSDIIELPRPKTLNIRRPHKSIFIPKKITGFQILSMPEEDILSELRQTIGAQRKEFEDKPLTSFEKVKLTIYKTLLKETSPDKLSRLKDSGRLIFFDKIFNLFSSEKSKLAEKILEDYQKLLERNKNRLEKLMNLLDKDPDEALKYAIPLDETGNSKGDTSGELTLSEKNYDFSSFRALVNHNKHRYNSGSSYIMEDDSYLKLRNQYYETARKLVAKKEYLKASFIYVKLLSDFQSAATMFENAEMYQEAAIVYLELLNNKKKAASCFETGNMLSKAIELYEQSGMNEKVGDLYIKLNNKKEADIYYEKVVNSYINTGQYVKASLICRNKIGDASKGQSYLLEGWRKNADSFNCLNNYFANIDDEVILGKEIDRIYKEEVHKRNSELFLKVIKHEFFKANSLEEKIKDIVYTIIASALPENPHLTNELIDFNKKDRHLAKDTLRFRLGKR